MKIPDKDDFSKDLKKERERIGLKQSEVADILEVSLRTYAIWERAQSAKKAPLKIAQEGALARLAKIKTAKE